MYLQPNRDTKPWKSDFIWLGHSLKMNNLGMVEVTDARFLSKIKSIRAAVLEIFNITKCLVMRHRIFRTYISPIFDFYIPAVIVRDLRERNQFTKLQHELLTYVMDLGPSAPEHDTRKHLRIRSIAERVVICSKRMSTYCDTIETVHNFLASSCTGMLLRPGGYKADVYNNALQAREKRYQRISNVLPNPSQEGKQMDQPTDVRKRMDFIDHIRHHALDYDTVYDPTLRASKYPIIKKYIEERRKIMHRHAKKKTMTRKRKVL